MTLTSFTNLAPWQWLVWVGLSALLAIVSRRALTNPSCHGFFRYFAFVGAVLVTLCAAPYWHTDLFAPYQLASWTILFIALWYLVESLLLLIRFGGRRDQQQPSENFAFENTQHLVRRGIFRWVRHPMYGALILYSWGAWLKYPSPWATLGALITTLFLWLTAKAEEKENLQFFGADYENYKAASKHFIPKIW